MKRLITTVRNLILGGAVLLSSLAQAQFTSFTPTGSYKFPQQPSYVAGRTPASISVADAQKAYEDWKRDFVTSSGACGERRVIWDYFSGGRGKTDKSSTVSEGVAYGMLLAAYAADKDLFDDLWDYYKKHRNGNGVMNWQIENCSVKGYNGASDAELDAAMALIVASHQWQSDSYLNDAKSLIKIVREKEFQNDVLKPGDMFGGSALTNPSYFSPAYYRVFAQLEPSQATFWNNAITKGYQIISAADKSNNGLVPDWCDAAGNKVNGKNIDGININSTYEDGGQNFIYDAIRTPFRSAVDYLWHGDKSPQGKAYCTKLIDWAYNNHGGTTNQLGSKYSTTGSKIGNDHSNTFVSCFSIAAMAADGGTHTATQYQNFLNSGYADNKNTQPGYGQYFNATFKALGFFVMSGHFYLPPPDACTSPALGADKSLCKAVTLDAGVTGRNYTWKKDGVIQIGKTAQTLPVTLPGIYEVIATDSKGCTRRDAVEVFAADIKADFIYQKQGADVIFTSTSTGGITNYTWKKATVAVGTDAPTLSQTLTTGTYAYSLTVTNAGYGCTATNTATKTVIIGEGKGWAAHDFNSYSVAEPFVASDNVGGNWVPIAAFAPGLPKKADGSANNPCSFLEIQCKGGGTADQYKPFGINLREATPACNTPTAANNYCSRYAAVDISAAKFISFKIRSTAPASIRVDLGASGGTKGDGPTVDIAANKDTIVTINFATYGTAWGQTGSIDWTKINAIQFFPFITKTTFTGKLSIDWIVIGDKQMPTPQFALETDASGDYIYVPDVDSPLYDPNDDPKDWPYTEKNVWEREVLACAGTAQIDASSCWADEIRLYQGNNLIGTGALHTVPAGDYRVELINAGGKTEDVVTVKSANVVADFTVDRDNLSAKFNNNSSDYDTFTWNYGDVANDEPGSTTWDIGYHDYATAVGTATTKTFPVKLTVTNTECGISKVITKQVTFSCDSPAEFEYTVSKTTGLCEGEVITAEITSSAHAVWFGFFPPSDATTVLSTDKKKATITLGASSGDLSIQADNGCSAVNVEEVVALANTAKPLATFTALEEPNRKVSFNASEVGATSYTWAFGDATSGTGKTVAHTYATAKVYNACLTVVNACGTKQTCKDVSATITGLAGQDAAGNISVYPTAVSSEIGVILPGKAKVSVIDVLGNTLREENMNDKGSINVSELKAGMYLLNIEQNGEVITKRFVKE